MALLGLMTFASMAQAHEERVRHYEAAKPGSVTAAIALFHDSHKHIAEVLEADSLTTQQLEAVHEQSYGLEAAVDALREMQAFPETLIDDTDEAVQALHYASEKHEANVTREWFDKLTQLSSKLTLNP